VKVKPPPYRRDPPPCSPQLHPAPVVMQAAAPAVTTAAALVISVRLAPHHHDRRLDSGAVRGGTGRQVCGAGRPILSRKLFLGRTKVALAELRFSQKGGPRIPSNLWFTDA
jgi:hypothetical protein